MNRDFEAYLARKRQEYGDLFVPPTTAQFIPYFGTDVRIKVQTSYGDVITGTVGVTTGWRPAFLLMRRSNAWGSSVTLGENDRIIAVQHDRKYQVL